MKDKLTDLWGDWLLHNNLLNTFCEITTLLRWSRKASSRSRARRRVNPNPANLVPIWPPSSKPSQTPFIPSSPDSYPLLPLTARYLSLTVLYVPHSCLRLSCMCRICYVLDCPIYATFARQRCAFAACLVWPWLRGQRPFTVSRCSLFARKRQTPWATLLSHTRCC